MNISYHPHQSPEPLGVPKGHSVLPSLERGRESLSFLNPDISSIVLKVSAQVHQIPEQALQESLQIVAGTSEELTVKSIQDAILDSLNTLTGIINKITDKYKDLENLLLSLQDSKNEENTMKVQNLLKGMKIEIKSLRKNINWILEGIDSKAIQIILLNQSDLDKVKSIQFNDLSQSLINFMLSILSPKSIVEIKLVEFLKEKGEEWNSSMGAYHNMWNYIQDMNKLLGNTSEEGES